ncbi:MAG: HAMP domain-containing sensor histidine kinase, partial [Pseudomonadota bacterium]
DLEIFGHAISHDLRGPIITIKGLLRWIEKDAKTGQFERLNKNIATVFRSADRMEELITDLLKLSRIATIEDETQELSFGEIAEEASDLLSTRISQTNVQLEIQQDLPVVKFCRSKLLTVIQNLLENAVKYMGDQTQPHVTVGHREEGGSHVFFVEDNGMGIKEEDQEKIFHLFVKLDEKTEGSGIGLAMLKRILDGSRGRIWVESEGLGQGSRFCFTLSDEGNRCSG